MSAQVFDIEKVISPLAGKPCGESAKYEPEYESLEAEVAKEGGLTPKPVAWDQVLRDAQTILETKSKDLLVAAYFTFALFDRKGYSGLLAGAKSLRTLVVNFWEDVHPEKKRMRGRIAAFEWLAGKLERALEQKRPGSGEAATVTECATVFEELSKALENHLLREAPDISKVTRMLRDYARDIDKPAPAAAAPTASSSASAAGGAMIGVSTEQDLPKALKQCQTQLRGAAAFIRGQKLEDPRSYRLVRIAAWLMLDKLPDVKDGKTLVTNSVSAETLQRYNGYIAEQKFAALIPEIEDGLLKSSSAPYWLDAHRLVANALDALGSNYAAARAVVVGELALLLKRLPDLITLKFADGTPYASEQTRAWIEQEVMTASGAPGPATATGVKDEAAPWVAAQAEIRQLMAKGKASDAMNLLREGVAHAGSQRDRFHWALTQAKYCLDSGMINVALPQLEHLEQQCQRFALEEWEPALALDVARVLLVCYAQAAEKNRKLKDSLAPKAEALYARICRLDPGAALKTEMKAFQS